MPPPAAAQTPGKEVDENAPQKENFMDSKIFRFLTVGLYLAGVSGLGVTISFYLLFFWDSTMPEVPVIQHKG